jgi:uncharacterized metal-binding protein
MTTPIRAIFGGSNRKHHLRMSAVYASALALLSVNNPGFFAWGYWWQMPQGVLWLIAGAFCYCHELWATADRDLEHKRKPRCLYWMPYDHFVKHRGILSHGLLIGTAVRLAYGWWPLGICLSLLWGLSPFLAAWLGVAIVVGALVNDIGHLALDL